MVRILSKPDASGLRPKARTAARLKAVKAKASSSKTPAGPEAENTGVEVAPAPVRKGRKGRKDADEEEGGEEALRECVLRTITRDLNFPIRSESVPSRAARFRTILGA
ncbi:hypothetical protein FS749_006686 [Ceratobasidium sp. UAMH 11750]|nr:hypothetical protein FS749_006686 [Ceratobasidium sp. UAMH 11750]